MSMPVSFPVDEVMDLKARFPRHGELSAFVHSCVREKLDALDSESLDGLKKRCSELETERDGITSELSIIKEKIEKIEKVEAEAKRIIEEKAKQEADEREREETEEKARKERNEKCHEALVEFYEPIEKWFNYGISPSSDQILNGIKILESRYKALGTVLDVEDLIDTMHYDARYIAKESGKTEFLEPFEVLRQEVAAKLGIKLEEAIKKDNY